MLLERSSEFVLRNPAQKKKTLRADKDRVTYLAFAGYETEAQERQIIEKQIAKLPADARVYILSRYRYDIGSVFPEVANVVKGENGGAISLTLAGRKVQALPPTPAKDWRRIMSFLSTAIAGMTTMVFLRRWQTTRLWSMCSVSRIRMTTQRNAAFSIWQLRGRNGRLMCFMTSNIRHCLLPSWAVCRPRLRIANGYALGAARVH